MARPLSDDKRKAILNAAARMIAERGIGGTPTSAISRTAGVAEGSLFTYFKTKDELMNALYRDIKREIAGVLMTNYPRQEDVKARMRHIWDSYVGWALRNKERHNALRQLEVSGKLSCESTAAGAEPFVEVMQTAQEAMAKGKLKDAPLEFLSAMLEAQMEATMGFMADHPRMAAKYRALGFDLLWDGVAGK